MDTQKRGPKKFGAMTGTRIVKNTAPVDLSVSGAVPQPVRVPLAVPVKPVEEESDILVPAIEIATPAPTTVTAPVPAAPEELPVEAPASEVPPAAPVASQKPRTFAIKSRAQQKTEKLQKIREFETAKKDEEEHNRYLLVPGSVDPAKRLPSAFHPQTRAGLGDFLYTTFRSFTLEPIRQDLTQDACKKLMAGPGAGNQVEMFLYQKFVREYIRGKTPYRGILVYHGLGSGKTCSSIAGAEALYGASGKKIIIMTPSSLRGNFQSQIQFCGFRHYQLDNNWVFQSLDDADSIQALYSRSLLNLSREYIVELSGKPDHLRGVWYPDFSRKRGQHYNTLLPDVQAAIRQQIVDSLENSISFINYNGITSAKLKSLYACGDSTFFDNAVIIIDEVHNLTRLMAGKLRKYLLPPKVARRPGASASVAAERARALAENYEPIGVDEWRPKLCGSALNYERAYMLSRMLSCAKNSKIIALSGTPIINKPDEIGILLNMLNGYIHTASGALEGKSEEAKKILQRLVAEDERLDSIFFKPATGDAATTTPFTVSIFKEGYMKVFEDGPDGTKVFKGLAEAPLTADGDLDPKYQVGIKEAFARFIQAARMAGVKVRANTEEKVPGETYKAEPLFPPTRDEFNGIFVNHKTSKIENENTFMRRAYGLVSYYKGAIEGVMPKAIEHIVEVPLKGYALSYYLEKRKAEIEERVAEEGEPDDEEAGGAASSYRFNSRSASNFAFPAAIERPFLSKMMKMKDLSALLPPVAAEGVIELGEGAVSIEDVVKAEEEVKEVQAEEQGIREERAMRVGNAIETAKAATGAPVATKDDDDENIMRKYLNFGDDDDDDDDEDTNEENDSNYESNNSENFNSNEEEEDEDEEDEENEEDEDYEQEGGVTFKIRSAAPVTQLPAEGPPAEGPPPVEVPAAPVVPPSAPVIGQIADVAPTPVAPIKTARGISFIPKSRATTAPVPAAPVVPEVAIDAPTEAAVAAPTPVRKLGSIKLRTAPKVAPEFELTTAPEKPALKTRPVGSIFEAREGDVFYKKRADAAKLRDLMAEKDIRTHSVADSKTYLQALDNAIARLRRDRDLLFKLKNEDGTTGPLYDFSPKYAAMIERIEQTPGSSLVYSAFKTAEGLGIFGIALEANGYTKIEYTGKGEDIEFTEETVRSFTDPALKDKPRYIFFTGDGDLAIRKAILNIFNANIQSLPPKIKAVIQEAGYTNNIDGKICRVIGITSAGAEGISLKTVRAVHIMEPYWNRVRTEQVKGRAIRICSHMDIPDPAERTVNIYSYITVFDPADLESGRVTQQIKMRDAGRTTDQQIYDLAARKDQLNQSFIQTMKNIAVDCFFNSQQNKEEVFNPDGTTEVVYPSCFTGMAGTIDTPAYIPNVFEDKAANEGIRVRKADGQQVKELAATTIADTTASAAAATSKIIPKTEAEAVAAAMAPTRLRQRTAAPVEEAPAAPKEAPKPKKPGVVSYPSISYNGRSYFVVPPKRGSDAHILYELSDIRRTRPAGELVFSKTVKLPNGNFAPESIKIYGQ